MLLLFGISIFFRLVAVVWASLLAWQLRSWKLVSLPLAIATLSLPPVLAIMTGSPTPTFGLEEPGSTALVIFIMISNSGISIAAVYFVARVIREQRRIRSTLNDISGVYEQLGQAALSGIIIIDADTLRIQAANPMALAMYGYDYQRIVDRSIVELAAETGLATCEPVLTGQQRIAQLLNGRQRKSDGSTFPIEATTCQFPWNGRTLVAAIMQDVTQRQQTEAQLAFKADILAQIQDPIVCCAGPEMIVDYFNASAEKMYEVPAHEAIGKPYDKAFEYRWLNTDDFENCTKQLTSTGRWQGENLVITRSGRQLITDSTVRMFLDSEGQPIRSITVARDVTARKQMEQDLSERESLLQHMFDHAADAIILHELDGRVVRANDLACEELGYTREELMVINIFDVDNNTPSEEIRKGVQSMPSGMRHVTQTAVRRKDGTVIPVEVRGFVSEYGGRRVVLGIFHNISEQLEAETAKRKREAELAHVTRLSQLGAMVAGIAHEIKQPLYAIGNFAAANVANIRHDEQIDKEQLLRRLAQITEQATRASTIIDRLRLFSRKQTAPREVLSLAGVVADTRQLVDFDARRRQIDFQMRLDQSEGNVLGDQTQLQQVIVNLLCNAFAAVDEREPEVRKVTLTTENAVDDIRVWVDDSGVGLPADRQSIFEAFQTHKADGLGLGLTISRSIVEEHGGKIWAEDHSGGGARFVFTLPRYLARPTVPHSNGLATY